MERSEFLSILEKQFNESMPDILTIHESNAVDFIASCHWINNGENIITKEFNILNRKGKSEVSLIPNT
jgi:hypothetical protein